MCIDIYVIESDLRQKYLSKNLNGRRVNEALPTRVCEKTIFVLPTPLYKYEFENNVVRKSVSSTAKSIVFAGGICGVWEAFFQEHGIEYCDFMENEEITLANAEITAEGTLMLYIANSRVTVWGEKIIISGYGRCGRAIADKFGSLGAKVTVMDRKRERRLQAREAGYNAVDFSYGPQEAYGAMALINTVPSNVISDAILSELHQDCLLLEIASAPGGFDLEAVKKNKLTYIQVPGLPSKYMQKSGGQLLAGYVNAYIKNNFQCGVKDIWIYQVSP